jgi:CDP-6-deoxy-D-xylo-4-hexulose-3-dehydrase
VFTDDSELASRVREMRDWGRTLAFESGGVPGMPKEYERYTYTERGYNFQPLELQAAMGRVQLKRLKEFKDKRKENFHHLYGLLKDKVLLPEIREQADPCWYTLPLIVADRPGLIKRLDAAKIDWRPILAGNITRQPAYKDHVKTSGMLIVADTLFNYGIWLPVHPTLTINDMEYVARSV